MYDQFELTHFSSLSWRLESDPFGENRVENLGGIPLRCRAGIKAGKPDSAMSALKLAMQLLLWRLG